MPTTRVYLLRHAETATPNVFHGAESDVELSDKGRRQAAAVAKTLAVVRPELVISSAMRRAQETAHFIAEACAVTHHVEPLLHERRVGILSGMPYNTDVIWPETVQRWSAGQLDWAHDGAETFADIRRRVLPVWERVVAEHAGRSLVVVAHGIVCKVLLLTLFPEWTWVGLGSIRNVAVTELTYDGVAWQALRLNELPAGIAVLE